MKDLTLLYRPRDEFIYPGSRGPRARTNMVRIWLIGLLIVQREVGRLLLRWAMDLKHVHVCVYVHTYVRTYVHCVRAYANVIDGGFIKYR